MTSYLERAIQESKEREEKATKGPWRVVNEIDPNPIFLETWGPEYKTMWWIQRGGENDTPIHSNLENVSPKQTFLRKETAEFIAASRTWEPKWREMVQLSLSTFLVLKIQYELNKSETGCRKEGELINLTLSHLERLAKEGLNGAS